MKDSPKKKSSTEELERELQEARNTIKELEGKIDMYQRAINHLPQYYTFWKDVDLGFLGGDERFFQKGGYSSMEEMIGKTDHDSAWAKEADGFRNIDEMVIKQNLQNYTVIEQQTPADGITVWLSTTKSAINDDNGNVIGLVGISDDVTEKLRREKILRESENRFRQLSEASSEGVAIHKEGVITDTNLFLADMFNYGAKELIAMELVDLLSPEFKEVFNQRIEVKSKAPFRAVGLKKNPSPSSSAQVQFDIEITLRSDPIHAISIRDISEQMKGEKIKDDFLANTSHELRTPLNGIIGVSESLLAGVAGALPHKVKSNLSMIISSSRRLSNLVNDILDYSKMKNESLELHIKPVNLRDISELILTLSTPLVGNKPVVLINEIPDTVPAVMADEDRLQQILYNLIGNAIKFTAQGEVKINAEVIEDRIMISVSDTGIGIPNSRQKEIFKFFQQADSSTRRNYGGTGLGLSISRQLVQLHGSKLKVTSVPEKGSSFYFHLGKSDSSVELSATSRNLPTFTSLASIEPMVEDEAMSVPNNFTPQGRGQKILVVDDEPINLQMMKNVLQLHEYKVLSAQSGLQALDILQDEQPDLVILDVMMPRMDGYELCGLIRQSFDAWQLPIIFLTAKNQVSDRVKGLSSGASDFLTKPFYQEELLIRVKTHLRVKQSFETIRENQQLKIEIHRHKESELELESSSRRISGILDMHDNALIAVNENLDIVYLNQQAETILAYQRDSLLNKPVTLLLPDHFVRDFQKTIGDIDAQVVNDPTCKLDLELQVVTPSGDEKSLPTVVSISEIEDECIYIFTVDGVPKNSPVASLPRETVHELLKEQLLATDSIDFLEGLVTNVIEKMDLSASKVSAPAPEGSNLTTKSKDALFYRQDTFRNALVNLMKLSVLCWKESTEKSKWQLADESGLWKAYLDQGVYKTRTMNKYLKTDTLPMNPKWNRVLDTAEFVLNSHSGLRGENNHKLSNDLSTIMKIIGTHMKNE